MTAKRETPEQCLRGRSDCQPLHAIEGFSPGSGPSFICCGFSDVDSRNHVGDEYRVCFKTDVTDTIYDHDEMDMLDLIEVLSRGMSTASRLQSRG